MRQIASIVLPIGSKLTGVPAFIVHSYSMFKFSGVPDVGAVIAVIDLPRVMGFEWRQLAV